MEIKENEEKTFIEKDKTKRTSDLQSILNWLPWELLNTYFNLSLIHKIPQHTIWYDNILILRSNTKTKSEKKM